MRVLWVSICVVLLDQASKVAVLQTMHRGESIPIIGDWLKLTFTENPGMAFGLTIFPREATAVFSIIVTVVVLWYLYSVRSGYTPYLASLALVLGGAVGNIIDRAFYGVILGYGDFFSGKVVDFIHVDVWRGYLPHALPGIGGTYLPLFPIWNVADMSIVIGVVGILLLQRRFHRKTFEEPARERERLRELEREQEKAHAQQQGAPGAAATQASPAGSEVPPRAPSAENAGAAVDAPGEDETADGKFAPPGENSHGDGEDPDANADAADRSSVSSPEEERA